MILVLDYDGVLHPDSVYIERRRPVLRGPGELFMWADSLVEALQPWLNVQIVLSTSWVRFRGFERARDVLPVELRQRVIGATYHSGMARRAPEDGGFKMVETWWDRSTRYQQILGYVTRAGLSDRDWLAIDDNNEQWNERHTDNLILTTSISGISEPAALEKLQARLFAAHQAPGAT